MHKGSALSPLLFVIVMEAVYVENLELPRVSHWYRPQCPSFDFLSTVYDTVNDMPVYAKKWTLSRFISSFPNSM